MHRGHGTGKGLAGSVARALEAEQRSRCPFSAARLDRFEKTNEMLLNFNNLSSARLQQMNERFLHHTRTLVEMKRDLDSIFRRIRWVLPLQPPPPTPCLRFLIFSMRAVLST